MPVLRANRGRGRSSRGAASSVRGRANAASRGKPTSSVAGVRKTPSRAHKKRPVQPRVAAALERAVAEPADLPDEHPAIEISAPSPSPPTVERLRSGDFMCSSESLFFVQLGELYTTPDTETIALNLMDHFLQPSQFIPELWHGLLHAVCFLLASRLAGLENEVQWIAQAVEAQAAGLALMGAADLYVDIGKVEEGCNALLERREDLKPLVGPYAEALDKLAVPSSTSGEATGIAAEEEPNAVEPVDAIQEAEQAEELADFDVFDEPEGV